MKTTITYLFIFSSLLLVLSCSDKKKTQETTEQKATTIETSKEVREASDVKDTKETKNTTDTSTEEIKIRPYHYICYTNDDKPSLQLSIAFNEEGNALFVRYKGQQSSIPLVNVKENFENDGAYPTITQFYNEMYNGKKNGVYELTHSGNWDYAKYIREKDGKVFKFTINHELTVTGNGYRATPCW
ncbi:hypothetical protein [uncultured Kordia sp.]|uniref:hypothetical protein n=1 Tax=uncultured Kordia sp. TaxID=507699 RepID=UPI002604756F|nr:hypothetical protein [uncultured Kordia sp.]